MRSSSRWRLAVVFAALGAALTLAACGGSDSSDSDGTTSAASDGTTSAEATAVPAPPTAAITEFPAMQPLKSKAPAKDVIWVACALESCQGKHSEAYKKAAAAIGWNLEQINYETADAAAGVQQALNANPDYIFITGIPPEAFEAQAKEAVKKGIPILNGFDVTPPDPKVNGVYVNYPSAKGAEAEAEQIAAWMINDAGGKANAVSVTIDEYPILVNEYEALERTFEKCPDCSLDKLAVTVEDTAGGKIGAKLAAYLQQHPDVNYVEFAFGDLVTGVEAALEAAGLGDQAKFTGIQATPTITQEIADGKIAAWIAQPQEFSAWMKMDAAARLAEKMPLEQIQEEGLLPSWVIDSKEEAQKILDQGGQWPGPAGFEAEFEKLWGV